MNCKEPLMDGLSYELKYEAGEWFVWTPDDEGGVIGVGTSKLNALLNALHNLAILSETIGRDVSSACGIHGLAAANQGKVNLNADLICVECGKYPADLPSNLCTGCAAYKEHTAI